ncbi:hypothetical protein BD410DRAFT_840682 [Rickenella mellea]|uniref:Uncharacterized protein n=1 Tax=Rickenella mellea TaxID=50990 RepID=A0A4Y7Q0M5_9AGAM|nr:hypothetical protein BD410DRAFT_840682 [Rickenella mellea]
MEGLDDLLNLLTRVKHNGWDDAFPDNPFDNYSTETKRDLPPSRHLLTFMNAIEEARTCMRALNEAQRRVGKRLRCLRRLGKPLVLEHGIKRLPDEVMAIIFEMGRHFIGGGPYEFGVCVSHVSRRFRRIALATPLLWTAIRDSYPENQIREFVSRSRQLDLVVGMTVHSSARSFLKALKNTSHRWSSLDIIEDNADYLMEKLGITDLPRLRQLTYSHPHVPMFSLPRPSQAGGWRWEVFSGKWFLSQLTHVELHISGDELIEEIAATIHRMTNLQDLSLKLENCTVGEEEFELSDDAPEPHSVPIDRLAVTIFGDMREYAVSMFNALMHFRPSTVELSIHSSRPEMFLYNSTDGYFPYGSAIKLHTPQMIDVMVALADLLQSCDIVKTVHFDAPMGSGPLQWRWRGLDSDDWERIRSLDHLRFMNCDQFTESDVEALARNILQTEVESRIQSLEINSCKLVSEDFLLGLHDEVGDRLKWTL